MIGPRMRSMVVAIIILALAAPVPMGVAQPSGATPDLVIIDLQPSVIPEWIDGNPSPTKTSVQATIKNIGGSPASGYRISYYWVHEGQQMWLNGKQSNSFDVSDDEPLGAGNSRTLPPMPWTIQPDQKGMVALRAVLTPLGADQKSSNDVFTTEPFNIPVHALRVTSAGPAQNLHDPQDSRFTRITVSNEGNVDEPVDLAITQVTASPQDRTEDLHFELQKTSLSIPPGGQASSVLFVDYVFSGEEEPFSVAATISARTAYGSTFTVNTPLFLKDDAPRRLASPIHIETADDEEHIVPESGKAETWFSVTNMGQRLDTYRVYPATKTGWSGLVALEGLPSEPSIRLALDPGETQRVRFTLEAPDDVLPGQPTQAGIRIQADRSAPAVDQWLDFRATGPAMRIESIPDWEFQPYQGDAIRIPVVLVNDGDASTGPNNELRISLSQAQTLLAKESTVPVGPQASRSMDFQTEGTFSGAGPVRAELSWWSPDGEIYQEPLHITGFIHAPDVSIQPADSLTGAPGQIVRYRTGDHSFTITNTGNAEETYNVSVQADIGNTTLLIDPNIRLAPGQQRTVPFDHEIPSPTGPLRHISVSMNVSIQGRDEIKWTSNTTTQIFDQSPPVFGKWGLPEEWALNGLLPIQIDVQDESAVTYVNITHISPNGTKQELHAAPPSTGGSDDAWWTNVLLDSVGSHAFLVNATDAHGNHATTRSIEVSVSPIPPPALTLSGPAESETVLRDATFEVHVHDTRPISRVTVTLARLDGTNVSKTDLDPEADPVMFDLTDAPGGPLVITVQAMNNAGAVTTVSRTVLVQVPDESGLTDGGLGPEGRDTPFPASLFVLLVVLLGAGFMRRGPGRTPNDHVGDRRNGGLQ